MNYTLSQEDQTTLARTKKTCLHTFVCVFIFFFFFKLKMVSKQLILLHFPSGVGLRLFKRPYCETTSADQI